MRGLRQCGSEDIFNLPLQVDRGKLQTPYSRDDMYFLINPDDDESDPSLMESDSEEDSFEFEPIPIRPFFELETRGDPRDASVYVELMTQILREDEPHHLIAHGSVQLLQGSKITHFRFLLGEWLFSLSICYPASTETLFQAVSLLDRYLAKRQVTFSKLQLISCCCLWVSAKVELHTEDSLEPLIAYCHNKFTRADFIRAEGEILSAIDYELQSVTPHFFLKRFLNAIDADERVALIASFVCDSTLLFLELSPFRPSVIAFCAIIMTCAVFRISEAIQKVVSFTNCLNRGETMRCFELVVKAAQAVSAREEHCPFRKYAARPIAGVPGAGAELIKTVAFDADLIRCMAALFDQ
jgi:cyclin B